MDRILGRSVVDLAGAVDDALGRLAQARGLQEAARHALALADDDVRDAQQAVESARDALFEEHPDLRPQGVTVAQPTQHTGPVVPAPLSGDIEGTLDPSKFEAVEVDDSDDPRYTAGASVVSASESDELPPIVWGEHDE